MKTWIANNATLDLRNIKSNDENVIKGNQDYILFNFWKLLIELKTHFKGFFF
jgi:hypothetical protein